MRHAPRAEAGFTLIELTTVVSIIMALAAVLVPVVASSTRDSQVAQILTVTTTIRDAVMRYHSDLGLCPIESSTGTSAAQHQLALAQASASWKGPYIDHVVTPGDHPFAGQVQVFDTLNETTGGLIGFDLLGGGTATSTGYGSFIRFLGIPADIAEDVNAALDGGVGGIWSTSGRVKWSAANGLNIFLYDPPDP